ncbi:hypothetical protein I4F81_001679 [Pyropia yezoensis]|uniref:Uncharacterized protein n=1 Tax=Pyropia yezoensis TaxID=2788 RepID=A0ACC3BMA6_PYRYE|nr:hypothetical protein I4F81_001679 [Neopyropia yezoensis]
MAVGVATAENTTPSPARKMDCVNPATGEAYAFVPLTPVADVAGIRAAAAKAQVAWAARPVKERVAVVSAFLDSFVDRGEAVAAAVSAAAGKPAYAAMDEVILLAAAGRAFAAGAPEWLADDTSRSCALMGSRPSVVRRVPLGVVAMITPYNFPLLLALSNTLAALLAGNAVMLKVSEAVPGIGKLIEELFAELADGDLAPLVSVLYGGGDVGSAMVDAAIGKPDHVLFIGSGAVGRKVAMAAAAGGVGCTLELGGKDAAVVCADADVPAAVEAIAYGALYNSGQCCIGVERAYVVDDVYDDFVNAMVKHVKEKVSYGYTPAPGAGTGNGNTDGDKDVTYGCAIVPAQLKTVQAHVDAAVAAGAKVLTGGQSDGKCYPPTVLTMPDGPGAEAGAGNSTTTGATTGPATATPLLETETFGPVLPIMRVPTAEAGVAAANATEFGLGGYVFTRDTQPGGMGDRLAREMVTGGVVVNDTLLQFLHSGLPFGGRRSSGTGRTGGKEGLLGFTACQTIITCDAAGAPDWQHRFSYEAKLDALKSLYGRTEG